MIIASKSFRRPVHAPSEIIPRQPVPSRILHVTHRVLTAAAKVASEIDTKPVVTKKKFSELPKIAHSAGPESTTGNDWFGGLEDAHVVRRKKRMSVSGCAPSYSVYAFGR
jgi:hypothetical protein